MEKSHKISISVLSYSLCVALLLAGLSNAQEMKLLWADEFDSSLDLTIWDFGIGPTNDNVHYYTSRSENLKIVDGVLNIIALKESYQSFDYTSALIQTKIHWRYGRVEARIRLPKTKGFVPAFWMLPADNMYGWWPNSGEIDIMEHPTNEVSKIYGTVHSETYNSFTGIGPQGGTIDIPNAETEFHVYAVEWDKDQIKFYVDDKAYFSFKNDHTTPAKWPFDKPFYIILNLAVGGGWVGNPDETTVFPAVMEVDYVRVYQYVNDIGIQGEDFVTYDKANTRYTLPKLENVKYAWEVPGNAEIASGQNTHQIYIDWNYFGGSLLASMNSGDADQAIEYPVNVSSNLLKNSGFEKGVKYWIKRVGYPAESDFNLQTGDAPFGSTALRIDVNKLSAYPWDIQLSHANLSLKAGQKYLLSFWAKSDHTDGKINLSLINANFYVYHGKEFKLKTDWTLYTTEYTATKNDIININIDMGFETGVYYFDNFQFTTPELSSLNQIESADFFYDHSSWNFTTLSTAQAIDTVVNGELMVDITNGGAEVWDIHLGQSGLYFENGKEYTVWFDAYAETPRTISVITGMNKDPWTTYNGEKIIPILTDKLTYKFSFIMKSVTDDQARFGFDIGKSTTNLYFDNIRVSSGTTPNSLIDASAVPNTLALFQNYPNPFNSQTRISYALPAASDIKIEVLNILGQHVATLVDGRKPAGVHFINFNAGHLASGLYFYTFETPGVRYIRKLLLLR